MINWFEHLYPYSNFHELNLDWILQASKKLYADLETFTNLNSLTFADPILWDIKKQYSRGTIVLNSTGDAFVSKEIVPAGIQLNKVDYWKEIFNFADYVRTANSNLTFNVEIATERASQAYEEDDWLIWNDVLYNVTTDIPKDGLLEVGTNIVHFTVEDFIKAWITYATNLINQYKIDIDASELAYKNEIDASELAYRNQLSNDIASTTASLQAQLNAAIAGATVDSEVINAHVGANGETYETLGDAIRSQIDYLQSVNIDHYALPHDSWVDGKSINITTGQQGSVVNYSWAGGEIINGCSKLLVASCIDSSSSGIAFYDEAGTFISGETFTITSPASLTFNIIDVPSDAKSFKFDTKTANKSTSFVMDVTNFTTYYNSLLDVINDVVNYLLGNYGDYTITWVNNQYVNEATGAFTSYNGFKNSGYVEIDDNVKSLSFTANYSTQFCAFYDTDHTCIGGFALKNGTTIISVPVNAKYFAVSIGSDKDISSIKNIFDTIQKLTKSRINNADQLAYFEDILHLNYDVYTNDEIELNNINGNYLILKDLPHNIITLDRTRKVISSVTMTTDISNVITLDGTNSASSYVEFFRQTLPKGEYYFKGSGVDNTSFKVSGNGVRNSPKYSTDGIISFGVLDDSEPVLLEIGIIRDIAYSDSEFEITLTRKFDSVDYGDIPKGNYNIYVKDSSDVIDTYEIDENTTSLIVPVPTDKTASIYTDYNFKFQVATIKPIYYLTEILNKPFNYSGKKTLIVGDSIALGYWSAQTHANYFATYFKSKANLGTLTNIAQGGATYAVIEDTDNVLEELQSVTLSDYDVIIILCGTNDFTNGVSESNFNSALTNISSYINSNKDADAQVIIITPVGRTRPANNFVLSLNKYREMITFWALTNQYTLIDGSKAGIPDIDSTYSQTVLADGIHPNDLGHHLIADYLTKLL